MRELRQAIPPWVIRSSQNDASLPPDHYRVEVIGGDKLAAKPSAKVRREIFEKAANRCEVCGIGLGEEYAEYPGTVARLQLGHWVPLDQGGSATRASNLRSECHLCNGAIRHLAGQLPTPNSVEARLRVLRRAARSDFLRWIEQGRRDVDPVETLFYEFRQLPAEVRADILQRVRETLETEK